MAKQYTAEYKEYVCRLVVEDGQTMAELGRELAISSSTINGWVRAYKKQTGWYSSHQQSKINAAQSQANNTLKTPTDYEMKLKQQDKIIRRLEEENAILKKSMHFFKQAPE